MNNLRDQEQIDELRKRLYDRDFSPARATPVATPTPQKVDVSRNWNTPQTMVKNTPREEVSDVVVLPEKKNRSYRTYVLLGSLLIFIIMAAFSTAYLIFGGKGISGDNITINISGPTNIGGGETLSLQVGVNNQNTVAIESAVLILKYPEGSQTTGEPRQDIYEERIPIDTLAPGEARNVAVQVAVFGEENQEKQVAATFEYRIIGSNGTFYKEAAPFLFKINSSPLVLTINSVTKVAAGQKIDMVVTGRSNSSQPLKNVLLTGSFPEGFTLVSAEPKSVFNQNVWRIDELLPEQSFSITIKGEVNGLANENLNFSFSAGPAKTDNQFIVGSVMASTRTELTIEKPFIDVDIKIAGSTDNPVIIPVGKEATDVVIDVINTLDEAVYDMVVEVVPSGNVINQNSISTREGFYDSNRGVIRYEVANNPNFAQVRPGDSRQLDFSIVPAKINSTATFDLVVNVYAKRIAEVSAQEQLIGTSKASAKYASDAVVSTTMRVLSGPVPPKVGETTTYGVTLTVGASGNDITGAVVTASLPTYVTWQNEYQGTGNVSYNPVSKQLQWQVGDVDGGTQKELLFAVSLLPSASQVGITPVLVNRPELQATDRFTGTSFTNFAQPLTTELSRESGYDDGNGRIIQ
jgi:hypothetical protein